MGKVIEEKYKDVNHRIIKKSLKKDKPSTRSPGDLTSSKRKLPSIEDIEQPKAKLSRVEYPQEKNPDPTILPKIVNPKQSEVTCNQIHVVKSCKGLRLEIRENKSKDLFLQDELSNSYENFTNNDMAFQILDEISLEGLDGITIEAFWKRLSAGIEKMTNISDNIKESVWKFICSKKDIKFYKLLEPRGVLDIYDRYKYLDAEAGVVIELPYEWPDIYPHELINEPDVQGSCSTFSTRTDITSEVINLDLKTAEQRYGMSLVMVADQRLRRHALFCESADPTMELINMEYCILERIGRSRKQGELTQGNMSIGSHFNMDPKSVFHYKKQLVQYKLLAKQFFYIKSVVDDQNKSGKLLHLKRFFHRIKPKQMLLAEQIVGVMKDRPDCRIECTELKKIFQEFMRPVSKILKSSEFRKYIKTQLFCYRDIYPNAKKSEYMRKAKPIEKYIKCIELINPCVNVTATWCAESDESDEEILEEQENTGGKIINMECFKEVYYHILSKGKKGCTLRDIKKLMGVNRNTVRMCLKKLQTSNTVTVQKFDQGKQRYLLYYANIKELGENEIYPKPEPAKTANDVLEKFKERQRIRIEASKQTPAGKSDFTHKRLEIKWKYEVKLPEMVYPFPISKIPKYIYRVEDVLMKINFVPNDMTRRIKLNTDFPSKENLFEINKLLNEINSEVPTRAFRVNFDPDKAYSSRSDLNYVMKLILLKAALGHEVINANTLGCFSRKRQLPDSSAPSDAEKEKPRPGNDKLQYMGIAPVTVLSEREGDMCVEIVVSTPPKKFKNESVYPARKELSERVMSRIGIILRTVYEKKIFEDVLKMIKIITEEEFKEGYTKKIDRKSLARLYKRLVEEGYVKIFKLSISDGKLAKVQTFVCVPSVSHTDSLIQSACQQLKWKHFVGAPKKPAKTNAPGGIQKSLEEKLQRTASPFKQSDVMRSVMELKELNKMQQREVAYKASRQAGRTYGFKPKFVRMRIIHEFLYYLIYNYDRTSQPLTEDGVERLFESYHIKVTKDDLRQIPNVYCNEISWKMFIPPLPHHSGWISGWALMCDLILRLPISVLCKIHNVGFDMPELLEVLNHPIKRFYLVKNLPEKVRVSVLFKRKYLFDIHDTICRLAWCGLVQFGPHKFKEKDQVFIYLNKKASLFDTTTSEAAYNKITDKEYTKLDFVFNSQADIDSYWCNAYGICLSTKLNLKQGGQLVTIFDPQSRPELANALKSKTPEVALQDDNGEIPGDKRGAAGFDSSLWSHIMRNWFWANQRPCSKDKPANTGLRKEKLEKVLPKTLSYNDLHIIGHANKVYLHKTAKDVKEPKAKLRKYVHTPLKPSRSMQKITRKIPFRAKPGKRQYNDHLDKAILKKIGVNVRVKWNEKEDRVLLLSMAVCKFLNPRHPRKQIVPYVVVRDVLHRVCPESKNKTSSAVQRRMKSYLAPRHLYIEDNVSQLLEIKAVSDYYSPLVNDLLKVKKEEDKPVRYSEAQLSQAFVILMAYLLTHPEDAENVLQGKSINIDHLAKDRLKSTENNLVLTEEVLPKYVDVKDEDDIKKDVLKSVIHSSLGCKNRPGWTIQLFKIYQKYPDNLICDALTELKRSQAISFKKLVTKKAKNRWHTPFQLSNLYIFSRSATFNVTTAVESYKTFLHLKENDKFLNFSQEAIEVKKYGQLLGFNEFCSFWEGVRFQFYLPRTMVMLNPHIKDHSELIEELAVRWHAKLKKIFQDNADTDLDQDNENENRSKSQDFMTRDNSVSEVDNPRSNQNLNDNQNNPLDLTVEVGDSETIDRLKHWVSDCIKAERERRSPSPEFMNLDDLDPEETPKSDRKGADVELEQQDCYGYDETDKLSVYNLRKMLTKDQIPSVEEIKEGMLKYTSPNEDRVIPYITDLNLSLSRDFTDSSVDEDKLERLKNHFITQYAVLEDVTVHRAEELRDYFLVQYIESVPRNRRVWDKITNDLVLKKPKATEEVYRVLAEQTATPRDFELTERIVNFVLEKKFLGASVAEIKENFRPEEGSCSLELILETLMDAGILLCVGICSFSFVHHVHQSPWLVKTFSLSEEEQKFLEEKATSNPDVRENIDKQLEDKSTVRIRVRPWVKVDGTLNEEEFKSWLCNVLSHCLDHPGVTFSKLCEKFCYVKPVDVYYLVEILKEMGCIELYAYEEIEQDLFSCWEYVKERDATFLDDFESIYITPNNASMTCMGSFLCQNLLIS